MQKQVALVQMLDTMALVRRARTALANGGKRALTSLIRLIELILCNMFGQRVWRENKHNSFWRFVAILNVRAFEVGFAPQTVWRQVQMAFFLQLSYVFATKAWRVARKRVFCSSESKRLQRKMKTAKTYEEWKNAAECLDDVTGNGAWKAYSPSTVYDWKRLERKLGHFEDLLLKRTPGLQKESQQSTSEDWIHGLLFHLRAGLSRDQCGLGHPELYSRAHVGTKCLVETYVAQVSNLLQMVVESDKLTSDTKLAFFHQTRHSYGRTALLLSGGATMGLFHLAMVKALHEQQLLPHIISGASAGSIVAAMVACKIEPELNQMFDPYSYAHFTMLGTEEEQRGVDPLTARLRNLFHKGVMFDTSVLKAFLREQVGDLTFQEAFDRTGRVLNITVQPSNPGQGASRQPRLLNYLTYPHVLVWSAAVASCAIPGVFDPVELFAKDHNGLVVPHSNEGVKYADGSFGNDLPMLRLKELFNVNLFIVSQVNPISIAVGNCTLGQTDIAASAIRFLKNQATSFLRNLWRTDFLHWVPMLRIVIPTITQDMEGDITCVAPIAFKDLYNLLENPSADRLQDIIERGERNVWPIISQIDTRCLIEFALDDCIQQVRAEMHQSRGHVQPAGSLTSPTNPPGAFAVGLLASISGNLSNTSSAELAAICDGLQVEGNHTTKLTKRLSIDKARERRTSTTAGAPEGDYYHSHPSPASTPRSFSGTFKEISHISLNSELSDDKDKLELVEEEERRRSSEPQEEHRPTKEALLNGFLENTTNHDGQ